MLATTQGGSGSSSPGQSTWTRPVCLVCVSCFVSFFSVFSFSAFSGLFGSLFFVYFLYLFSFPFDYPFRVSSPVLSSLSFPLAIIRACPSRRPSLDKQMQVERDRTQTQICAPAGDPHGRSPPFFLRAYNEQVHKAQAGPDRRCSFTGPRQVHGWPMTTNLQARVILT